MTVWRSRVVRSAFNVAATDLTAHPDNARLHPAFQRVVVTDALAELGWLRAVIVNERTGRILDGHLRVELCAAQGVPVPQVDYVDLSDEEELLVLGLYDAIGEQAETNPDKLDALLDKIVTERESLRTLATDMRSRIAVMREEIALKRAAPESPKVLVRVGPYRLQIDRVQFEPWFAALGDTPDARVSTIKARLGIAEEVVSDPEPAP